MMEGLSSRPNEALVWLLPRNGTVGEAERFWSVIPNETE
jgi:hypothetical protein